MTFLSVLGFAFLSLVLAMLSAMVLAPFEALSWWARWYPEEDAERARKMVHPQAKQQDHKQFIVYLDGIYQGTFRRLAFIEDFLKELKLAFPEAVLVTDILPYSVFNLRLTDKHRPLSPFWERIQALQNKASPWGFLINLRNLFQVIVSADRRYGSIYNQGMTKLILRHLLMHGYDPKAPAPITLIGYSGGGQVAAGSAALLQRILKTPVNVIAIGGVMSGNNDFVGLNHWTQINSNQDPVEKLGAIFFPQRWPITRWSPWNKAKRQGKVSFVHLAGATHTGAGCYINRQAKPNTEENQLERTIKVIKQVL